MDSSPKVPMIKVDTRMRSSSAATAVAEFCVPYRWPSALIPPAISFQLYLCTTTRETVSYRCTITRETVVYLCFHHTRNR